MSLLSRVRRFAARHAMWRPETRLVAAVSGGSDSVAMAGLLHDLHHRRELRFEAIAHFNHQIRPEAEADEAFCRALADRLGIAFIADRSDVPGAARRNRQSIELAGRVARRAFLDRVLAQTGADCVATAHTQDDQAETVLLRLMRGTGQRGLGGIAPVRDRRIRPVLCATRTELRDHLELRGETWREDASNAEFTTFRNRIRHELLPYLEQHFNPSIRAALARAADASRADDDLLERMAAAASAALIERDGKTISVDLLGEGTGREHAGLRALPEALQRRVVIHALRLAGRRTPTQDDVGRVLERMEHFGRKWVLVHDAPAPFSFALPVPGEVRTDAGWIIQAEAFNEPQQHGTRADVAQIDAATVADGLLVRSRRRGDRMRPLGLGGSKKLQDVLVDRKIRRSERDALPLVTDVHGRIVWVAGHVLGEEFRVTARTTGVIILKLRRI